MSDTRIKMCGLRRSEDIAFANELLPDYIGFVFAQKSKRYVSPEKAAELVKLLDKRIVPVGVFVNAPVSDVIALYENGTIAAAQLHGSEDDDFIAALKNAGVPTIQAFKVEGPEDIVRAERSIADLVLLDSGSGSGVTFDHSLISGISRPYFLAGGLAPENVGEAVEKLRPFAVDASSSLETDGFKDFAKMKAFAEAVRNI